MPDPDKPDPDAPSPFVSEAYGVEGQEDLLAFYRKWAEDYDAQMLGLGYVSPRRIAGLLMAHLPDPASAVFDVGCGTGLTCVALAEQGYRNLDGIDLSEEMVRVAGGRGIYRELLAGDVTEPIARDDASYDGVISSGTFTHGHVGPEPLDELVRILRPGGVLACTVHQDLWQSMGFDRAFRALVDDGRMQCLHLELDRYYEEREPEGWFCVYAKRDAK